MADDEVVRAYESGVVVGMHNAETILNDRVAPLEVSVRLQALDRAMQFWREQRFIQDGTAEASGLVDTARVFEHYLSGSTD